MAILSNHSKAIKALIAVGIIPETCTSFELISKAGCPVRLKYEMFATEEQILQIAAALESNPEEARQLSRSIIFKARDSATAVQVDLP